MSDPLIQSFVKTWPYDLLVFIRMSGLFLVSPVFGQKTIPTLVKSGLCLLLTLIVVQTVQPTVDYGAIPVPVYGLLIIKELMVGAVLGFITLLFFSVCLVAGQIIDVELGLGAGSLFDPQMQTQTSVTGLFLNLLLSLYFILSDGHLRLIAILVYSVRKIPIGQVHLTPGFANWIGEQFALSFGLAVSLMLPFIAAALLTEVALGILMRAIPQLNAYMVGIPLKVLVGLAVLLMIQPLFQPFCDRLFSQMFSAAEQAVNSLGVSA